MCPDRPSSRSAIFNHRARQDSDREAPGDLRDRLVAPPGHRDHVAPELLGERLGHGADPPREAAASRVRSPPNPGQSPLDLYTARTAGTRAQTTRPWRRLTALSDIQP